jgi:sugar lactone lactonase YvrE
MNSPAGVAIDDSNNVYIADAASNRILKYTNQNVLLTLAGSGTAGFNPGNGTAATFNHPTGIVVGHDGMIYVADSLNHAIRKITPAGVVTTLAGTGQAGYTEGPVSTAQFNGPAGVAVDAAGTVYVADAGNQRIRKITTDGQVMLMAGNGNAGYSDLPGRFAEFDSPTGIAVDDSSNVYVADYNNHVIRKVAPSTAVTTFAGGAGQFVNPTGIAVDAARNVYVADRTSNLLKKITNGIVTTIAGNGTAAFQDGVPASAAFKFPAGIALDHSGNVYVADYGNNRVREMGVTLTVSTLAGSGVTGFADGQGLAVMFNRPNSITLDNAGNIYVADYYNKRIRKVTAQGLVSTFAGSDFAGTANGPVATATLFRPIGVAADGSGNVYFVDGQSLIRKISNGIVSIFAGSTTGFVDGPATTARFDSPWALTTDAAGNVYVSDNYNYAIRKITPAGVVTTLAGRGTPGYVDGTGLNAAFDNPRGLTVDPNGNVYVCDMYNNRIRKITPAGVVTTVAGSGPYIWGGYVDGPALTAQFNGPSGIVMDPSGNLYVTEANNRIRKISPDGMVSTFAGSGPAFALCFCFPIGADGAVRAARLSSPSGIAINSSGTMYVADYGGNCIRKIQ